MTVEERLAVLETKMEAMAETVTTIASDVAELKHLSTLGRGALMMLAKIGLYIGAALAVMDWLLTHLRGWLR